MMEKSEEESEIQWVLTRAQRRKYEQNKLPKDVRDLIDEANQFTGEIANTFIERQGYEHNENLTHLTIEDDLMDLPNLEDAPDSDDDDSTISTEPDTEDEDFEM